MCRKLLANPIIEDFTFEIDDGRVVVHCRRTRRTHPPVRFGVVVFPGSNTDADC